MCEDAQKLSLLVGFLRLSSGDAEGALAQLRLQAPPAMLEAFHAYYLGEAHFYRGDYAAAAAQFEAAASAAPPSLEARAKARLGEALLASGDPDRAVKALDVALKTMFSAPLLWQRAQARTSLGKRAAAWSDLKRIAVESPLHPYASAALEKLFAQSPYALSLEDRLRRLEALDSTRPLLALEEADQIWARSLARDPDSQARVAASGWRSPGAASRRPRRARCS
jgi:soluble lytic murein transglycosylase